MTVHLTLAQATLPAVAGGIGSVVPAVAMRVLDWFGVAPVLAVGWADNTTVLSVGSGLFGALITAGGLWLKLRQVSVEETTAEEAALLAARSAFEKDRQELVAEQSRYREELRTEITELRVALASLRGELNTRDMENRSLRHTVVQLGGTLPHS